MKVCAFGGCGKKAVKNGWCDGHNYQHKRGIPMRRLLTAETREEWLARMVSPEPNTGCWLWLGAFDPRRGYGGCRFRGEQMGAHRAVYQMLVGPIPKGLQIDHLCRQTACVNPRHLEPVTQRVNLARGFSPPTLNALKTSCSRGHAYTPENTLRNKHGWRRCRECVLAWRSERATEGARC